MRILITMSHGTNHWAATLDAFRSYLEGALEVRA